MLAIVYWAVSLQTFADIVDGFRRFTPPGELAQPFDRGYVHIYAEPDRVESSVATGPVSLPQVEVFSPDGSPVALVPYLRLPGTNDGWTYEIAGHRGVGFTSFFVDQPGVYRIVATGSDGMVLALGDGIGQEREKFTFNAVPYAFLGFLVGGIVAGVITRRTAGVGVHVGGPSHAVPYHALAARGLSRGRFGPQAVSSNRRSIASRGVV